MTDTAGGVTLARAVYAAFADADMAALAKLFAPDIEWWPAEGHPYWDGVKPWVGLYSVTTKWFVPAAAAYGGTFTVNPEYFHDAGDRVIVEGRYRGEVSATGTQVDAQFCHIWHVSGGSVRSFRQYMDTAQISAAFDTSMVPSATATPRPQ